MVQTAHFRDKEGPTAHLKIQTAHFRDKEGLTAHQRVKTTHFRDSQLTRESGQHTSETKRGLHSPSLSGHREIDTGKRTHKSFPNIDLNLHGVSPVLLPQ